MAKARVVLRGPLIFRKILTIAIHITNLHLATMLNDFEPGSAVDFVTKCCWNDLHFIWLNCLEYLNRRFKRINPNSFIAILCMCILPLYPQIIFKTL